MNNLSPLVNEMSFNMGELDNTLGSKQFSLIMLVVLTIRQS